MHKNNGTAIRYCAAIFVMVQHAGALAGKPLWGSHIGWLWIGHAGVLMFFALSGYLLMQRSQQETLTSFALARILRIFPMLVAVDLLTVLAGYFVTTAESYFPGATASVYDNLFWFSGLTLPGVKLSAPDFGWWWDGPLTVMNVAQWSIFYEIRAYLLLIALVTLGIAHDRRHFNFFFVVVLLLQPANTFLHWGDQRAFDVTAVFLFGCFLASERFDLDLRHLVIALAVAIFGFNLDTGWSKLVVYFGLALATVTLAFGRVPYFKIADKLPDLTYGIFLLHWPVQKFIIHFWHTNAELLLTTSFLASICIALPLHYAIEEPARRLRPIILSALDRAIPTRAHRAVSHSISQSTPSTE